MDNYRAVLAVPLQTRRQMDDHYDYRFAQPQISQIAHQKCAQNDTSHRDDFSEVEAQLKAWHTTRSTAL